MEEYTDEFYKFSKPYTTKTNEQVYWLKEHCINWRKRIENDTN